MTRQEDTEEVVNHQFAIITFQASSDNAVTRPASYGVSLDNNIKKKHQAYDANPGATPMAREYPPDILGQPQTPT